MKTDNVPRVLVVDDERANLTLMSEALKPGFRTIVAKSGAQALERALSATPPDVILLDIIMPEMDGYEVCRILKANERTRHIPVIFVSARSEVGDETRGLEIGAVDYITKPFNPAIVRARVRTHLESAMTRDKIAALLDNSGQGFLSFGQDLLVGEEYSRECRNLFGTPIAGFLIQDLLFPGDGIAREHFAKNVGRILAETDDFKVNLYVSLMPAEFRLNGRFLRAEYRLIGKGKMMLILTDITSEKELEREIHQERTRLKFIVSAVRETMDFFETLKSFEEFDTRRFGEIVASQASPCDMVDEVYRSIHTHKALFQQLDFPNMPPALHDLEAKLLDLRQAVSSTDGEALGTIYAQAGLRQALLRDLAVIEEALGAEFMEQRGRIFITAQQVRRLETLAGQLLDGRAVDPAGAAEELLRELGRSRRVSLKSMLRGYPKAVLQLAERMGKELLPFSIEGDDILVDPDRVRGFAKTLVHVFRNAVDHGMEPPEDRAALGKDERGRIGCSVAWRDGEIVVSISDDGRGLDIDAIKAETLSACLVTPEELSGMAEDAVLQLVFHKVLSTCRNVTDFSGRGVGLCAVKAALDALGGRVEVETKPGEGTTFRFIWKDMH